MIAVPVLYKRAQRGLFLQKIQHAIPAVVVLGDGMAHLSHDPHGVELALGVAEVGVSVLVICCNPARCATRSPRRGHRSKSRVMRPAHLLNPPPRARNIARMIALHLLQSRQRTTRQRSCRQQ